MMNETDLRFDTKRAKRIIAGRGQRVTWGRGVPESMFLSGRQLAKCKDCWEPKDCAPNDLKEDDTLYEVSKDGLVRECL